MRFPAGWFLVLLAASLPACRRDTPAAPDIVYVNGRVWTGDPARPDAEAIAIRGDRIVTVGASNAVGAMVGEHTRVVDLRGRRVVPGFNDAHWHLPARRTADLAGAGDTRQIIARLQAFARTLPGEAPVTGRGWGPSDFPALTPHRRHLDAAFPARPVILTDRDGHQVLVNGRALGLAGITRATPEPPNGRIVRDASGEPTGLLQEAATSLVDGLVPALTADDVYAAVLAEQAKAAAYGLTSLQVASPGDSSGVRLEAWQRVAREGRLDVRVRLAVPFERSVTRARLAELVALRDAHRGGLLTFGIAKGMLDGTIDAHTAALLAPYADRAGTGLPMWDVDTLNRTVAAYDNAGLQVQLHAVGDRAIRMALDAFAWAARTNGTFGRRHRIEHAELPAPGDVARFRALGVIASTQALFASPDAVTLTSFAPALGPERASRADAFNVFDAAGVRQAFGSDYPVFSMEVMRGVHAAVTRQLPDGTPPGGWYPANRISVTAALRHFTADAAWASFEEHEKGILAPGAFADFVVLSEDVFEMPAQRLWQVKALLTVMGGRVTWEASGAGDD